MTSAPLQPAPTERPPEEEEEDEEEEAFVPSWIKITDRSQCEIEFAKFQDKANSPLDDIVSDYGFVTRNPMDKRYDVYIESAEFIFANGSRNLTALEEHRKCMAYREEFRLVDEIFVNITGYGANMSTSKTYHEAYQYAKHIPMYYRQRIALSLQEEDYKSVFDKMKEACNWMSNYGKDTKEEGDKIVRDFERVQDQMAVSVRHYASLTTLFNNLFKEVMQKIEPAVNMAGFYLQNNITKINLAKEFEAPSFTKAVGDLADYNKQLVDVAKDFTDEMVKGKDKLETAYQQLFHLKLPVFNDYNVYRLQLVEDAAALNDSVWENLIGSLDEDLESSLTLMVTEAYERLMTPVEDLRTRLMEPVEELLVQVEDLDASLKEYKQATKMSTQFFM